MTEKKGKKGNPYFSAFNFKEGVQNLIENIQQMYLADGIPWVLGYSGGKDSTAVLQAVWMALAELPKSKRHKDVHVITTDTLVENPIVAAWVNNSLETLKSAASEAGLPIFPNKLIPKISDTYWVNLIGRGYPAPRPKFRWCTMRLKINPANAFIESVVKDHGEAIVVLGTRKQESATRAHVMKRFADESTRERLRAHTSLPNSFVYSPIEDWTSDDVWLFLMQLANPWGYNNKDLLTMYQGASPDGECPLVIDQSTPSCGDSRFGCWVCTLVTQDKSMTAMIQNDAEKEWMLPLLRLRDELIPRDRDGFPADRHLRDFRRMHGNVQIMKDGRTIPGPYTQATRENWLRKVLAAQEHIRKTGPEEMKNLELITLDELREIRRFWVNEKHEIEDSLPRIYEEVLERAFPDDRFAEDLPLSAQDIDLLKEVCGGDEMIFQLSRELISVERQYRNMVRRAGLFDALDKAFRRNFYDGEDDATAKAVRAQEILAAELMAIEDEPLVEELPGIEASPK